MVAAQDPDRGRVHPTRGVHDVGRAHQAFDACLGQVGRVHRRGASLVALHRHVHLEHGERGVEQAGGWPERQVALSVTPRARPGGSGPGRPLEDAVARAREPSPAVERSPDRLPPDHVELAQRRLRVVGWQEEERPGLALVGGKLPAAGRHPKRQPHQSRVCHETQRGTLGGAQEALIGFQQGEVHLPVRRRPGSGKDTRAWRTRAEPGSGGHPGRRYRSRASTFLYCMRTTLTSGAPDTATPSPAANTSAPGMPLPTSQFLTAVALALVSSRRPPARNRRRLGPG